MDRKPPLFLLLILGLGLASCNVPAQTTSPAPTPVSPSAEISATQRPSPEPSATETWTPIPPTATLTETPAPSETPTIEPTVTPIPTYAILRGVVNVEKVSCRYGPGAMYLFLYPMRQGATQDIIGRTDTGKWVLTQSHGDNKACWVKTEFMDIKGEVMSVEMVYPDQFSIPQSNQGYRQPWDVAAIRQEDQITISWKSEPLRPGDEESATSVLYVVETWVCQNGKLVFTPLGAYTAQVTVADEKGCTEPSHGRVFFSEKHGYAGPSEIPWPSAQ